MIAELDFIFSASHLQSNVQCVTVALKKSNLIVNNYIIYH